MKRFIILTTGDLPEAFYVASYLLNKEQHILLINFAKRSFSENFRVFMRLRKRRGLLYLGDLVLGKMLKGLFIDAKNVPFPEIDDIYKNNIKNQIEYFITNDFYNVSTLEAISKFDADYMIFAGVPFLKKTVYEKVKVFALNKHQGISPHFRGSDCTLWAMALKKYEYIGYTIHIVNDKADSGHILKRESIKMIKGENISDLLKCLHRKSMQGYLDVIGALINNQHISGAPQEVGGAHYPPAGISIIIRAAKNYREFVLQKE